MARTAVGAELVAAPLAPVPMLARVARVVGWAAIGAGLLVLLYLLYSLYFTNFQTGSVQKDLLEDWELEVGAVASPAGDAPVIAAPAAESPAGPAGLVAPGEAVAALRFVRPGSDEPLVSADSLFVVEGVGVPDLRRGPGHYPQTAQPGEPGNFAVAGHRTTYGAPFFHLDRVRPDDEVHVTGRSGTTWVYRVVEQRIVDPGAADVLAPDPLGTGRPTLTLTTCEPRFSNALRLVVFAELVA